MDGCKLRGATAGICSDVRVRPVERRLYTVLPTASKSGAMNIRFSE
jgi:hypothetical protein